MTELNKFPEQNEVVTEWVATKRGQEKYKAMQEEEARKNTNLKPLEDFLVQWKKKPNADLL